MVFKETTQTPSNYGGIVYLGPFGGGWRFSLGIQICDHMAIINLVTRQFKVTWGK